MSNFENIQEDLLADVLQAQEAEESDNSSSDEEGTRSSYRSTFHYEYLEKVLADIKEEIKGSTPHRQKLPNCYRDKSFWVRAPDPIFSLSTEQVVDPLNWCKPDVFVWLPRLMSPPPKLKCPQCHATNEVIKDYPHPRKVVDVDRCYYLLTSRHECKNPVCKSKLVIPTIYCRVKNLKLKFNRNFSCYE
jgi:hypothetical protein